MAGNEKCQFFKEIFYFYKLYIQSCTLYININKETLLHVPGATAPVDMLKKLEPQKIRFRLSIYTERKKKL